MYLAKVVSATVAASILFSGASVAFAQTKSANFSQGDRIVVALKVNVRSAANGKVLGQQQMGVKGTLVGGPANAAGYTWWNVKYDTGVSGWTAEDFIQQASVALVTPGQNGSAVASSHASNAANAASVARAIEALRTQLNAILAQIAALQAQSSH